VILKEGREREIVCDDCGESSGPVVDRSDFSIAVSVALDNGFRITQNGDGTWSHFCPSCSTSDYAAQLRLFGR
jgi:hypothetical protein